MNILSSRFDMAKTIMILAVASLFLPSCITAAYDAYKVGEMEWKDMEKRHQEAHRRAQENN